MRDNSNGRKRRPNDNRLLGNGWKREHAVDAQSASLPAPPPRWGRPRQPPNRPAGQHARCKIIIPTAAGGSPDLVARMLGTKLTERLGQPVVVESVTQGVGMVGNQMVSKSAPDGQPSRC